MSEILFPAFYILLGFVQFLFAGFIYISDRGRLSNRAVAGLVMILGVSNLSFAFQTTSLTLESAEPWLWVRLIAARIAGPAVFLASVAILRPNLYRKTWFRLPLLIIIAIVPIAVLLDITNVSQILLNNSLFLSPLDPSLGPAALLAVSDYTGGLLNSIYLFLVIFFPTLTIFFPALYVVLADRKRAPAHSRMALFIFFATLIPGVLQFAARVTVSHIVIFLSSLILTVGFVYIALRYSDSPVSMQRLSQSIAGWSMFNKLMIIPVAVVFPAVLIISVIALTFLERNTLELLGDNLRTVAATESRTVGGEIESQVNGLTTLSQDPLLSFLVTFRATIYTPLDAQAQADALAAREEEWQAAAGDLNQPLLRVLLSSGRNFFLQNYKDVFPLHTDILATDFLGGVVTATFTPESYDHSQFDWWQQAYNNGAGDIYIGAPEFDPVVGQFIINIAVPIFRSNEDTQASGVLLSRYSLAEINAELNRVIIGESGGVGLFTAEGQWIPTEGAMTEEDPNLNWDRLIDAERHWQVMPYAGIDSIVGWAELSETSVEMDQIINLRVASFSPIDEALGPVGAARTGTFVLSLLIIIASVIITAVIARQITKPLGELTQIAERIREGEADVRATIEGRDEIGTLASTFNAMTTQLRGLVSGLEQTVEERTRDVEKRALQLETASEVAREAASIRDVSVLLERVTHLISDRFSFYHAGIFLLDQQKEYAILQAASSPGGFRMIERGHKLQVGKVGVVGFAAGEGQPRLAQDVGADVIYYDNPDMPDTRSELALPLKIRDEVIGVLDVQSREPNAFSREDVQILQTMADQIAVAIDNARLLQSSEKALSDLEALYGQESREAWQKRVQTQPKAYSYNPSGVGAQSPESSGLGRPTENGGLNHLTKNLIFRGEVIGSIDLARDDTRNWSDDELALVEEILEQTGLALENARLVEQIRLRSDQIQLLQEITAIAATLLDEKELLEAVTNRLLRGLELLNCSVLLFDASKNEGTLAADVFAPGSSKPHALSGSTLALENNEVTLEVIRTKQTVVLYDVPTNPRAKQIEALVHHKDIQSVAIVPLIIGNDVIGVIGLSIGDPNHRFAEEDLALLDQISAQVATAINVARLFAAEQTGRQTEASRAERERLVASITAKVRASNDPQEILQTAVNELREALGARQAQVLIEPDTRSRERSGATKSLDGNGLEEENQSNGRDEEETQP